MDKVLSELQTSHRALYFGLKPRHLSCLISNIPTPTKSNAQPVGAADTNYRSNVILFYSELIRLHSLIAADLKRKPDLID